MGLAEFWQRQRMIESGELRPRVLKPRKKRMPKNSIFEQDLAKMPPAVLEKLVDIVKIKEALEDASRNLDERYKETNKSLETFDLNNKLWCVVYDVNKFIEKKCKLEDQHRQALGILRRRERRLRFRRRHSVPKRRGS